MTAAAPTRSAAEALPPEVRLHIGSFVDYRNAHELALVSSAWQEAAESAIWRTLDIDSLLLPAGDGGETRRRNLVERYRGLAAAIANRPSRAKLIENISFVPDEGSEKSILDTLQAAAPYLITLSLRYPHPEHRDDPFPDAGLPWYDTLLSDLSDLTPAIHVTKLALELGPRWSEPLSRALQFAPNVEELTLMSTMPLLEQDEVDWPRLERLHKLSVEIVYEATALLAIRFLENLAPNLKAVLLLGNALGRDIDIGLLRKIVGYPRLKVLSIGPGMSSQLLCRVLRERREGEEYGAGLEELHLSKIVSASPSQTTHCVSWRWITPADRQKASDFCLPLPSLRVIAGLCRQSELSAIMNQMEQALDGTRPLDFLADIHLCPRLTQILLGPNRRVLPPSVLPETFVTLDLFTSSNGVDELCVMAFRAPAALRREWAAAREAIGRLAWATDRDHHIVTQSTHSDRRNVWTKDTVIETTWVATSGRRVVSDSVWREMFRLSGKADLIEGAGQRDVELSTGAWESFARWSDSGTVVTYPNRDALVTDTSEMSVQA